MVRKRTAKQGTEHISEPIKEQMQMKGRGLEPDAVGKSALEYKEACENLKAGIKGLKDKAAEAMQRCIDQLKKAGRKDIQVDGKTIDIVKTPASEKLRMRSCTQKDFS